MIEVTQHVKNEWARFAQAAYANGRNDVGHRFSSAAALRSGSMIAVSRFDELQSQYRAWLCFNEYPPVELEPLRRGTDEWFAAHNSDEYFEMQDREIANKARETRERTAFD